MLCERCGTEIKDSGKKFCPACGSTLNTQYMVYTEPKMYETNDSMRQRTDAGRINGRYAGYSTTIPSQQTPPSQELQGNRPPLTAATRTAAREQQDTRQGARPGTAPGYKLSNKDDKPLIAEFIFSLFGLFGIGWLMGKETTVGVLLLLGSVFIYWPLMIVATVFTYGLGLICLGPLAIVAIIINILLLNRNLKRKALHFFVASTPPPPGKRPRH